MFVRSSRPHSQNNTKDRCSETATGKILFICLHVQLSNFVSYLRWCYASSLESIEALPYQRHFLVRIAVSEAKRHFTTPNLFKFLQQLQKYHEIIYKISLTIFSISQLSILCARWH